MNYTCAPDTVYSLIESVKLSPEGNVWRDSSDPLLKAAEKVVNWRLCNNLTLLEIWKSSYLTRWYCGLSISQS